MFLEREFFDLLLTTTNRKKSESWFLIYIVNTCDKFNRRVMYCAITDERHMFLCTIFCFDRSLNLHLCLLFRYFYSSHWFAFISFLFFRFVLSIYSYLYLKLLIFQCFCACAQNFTPAKILRIPCKTKGSVVNGNNTFANNILKIHHQNNTT